MLQFEIFSNFIAHVQIMQILWFLNITKTSHQIREIIARLARHQLVRQGEPRDETQVGLQQRRVDLDHGVDERWQEIVGTGRLALFGNSQRVQQRFAAAHNARQFLVTTLFTVHVDHFCVKRVKCLE